MCEQIPTVDDLPYSVPNRDIVEISDKVFPPQNSPDYHELDNVPCNSSNEKNKNAVYSILPLYQMYTSVYSRRLDNFHDDSLSAPDYDETGTLFSNPPTLNALALSSATSASSTHQSDTASGASGLLSTSAASTEGLIVADEETGAWQETILDNITKLNNLTDSDNEYAKAIKMDIFFTEDVGRFGVAPKFIDHLVFEYKQGDFLNGYILVENTSDKPIPFDMFYVLFEGNFVFHKTKTGLLNPETTKETKKFLEMFDLTASWHYGRIQNRVATEFENPYMSQYEYDPLDNTVASFGLERIIKPKTKYKRFFTFRIPEKLLDTSCGHNLVGHCDLPPSFGDTNMVEKLSPSMTRVADLAFVNASINYSFDARFIGKASMYKSKKVTSPKLDTEDPTVINSGGDEFLILKDLTKPLRILQNSPTYSSMAAKYAKYRYDKHMFNNLIQRVDEQIGIVKDMVKESQNAGLIAGIMSPAGTASSSENSSSSISLPSIMANEILKYRQLYKPKKKGKKATDGLFLDGEATHYKLFYPIQKKSLAGSVKYLGTLIASTSKVPHVIQYVPPKVFCNGIDDDNIWKIKVPIDLEYVLLDAYKLSHNLPEVTNVKVELVAQTIKSEGYPIPLEFNHDMIFESIVALDKPHNLMYSYNSNYFQKNIMDPFKRKATELQTLLHKLKGKNRFKMDPKLISDIRCMYNMSSKLLNMTVEDIKPRLDKWKVADTSVKPITYKKHLDLEIDLTSAQLKGSQNSVGKAYDNFCLVPSFQLCHMLRFYYLKVVIELNKDVLLLTVPLEIEK